MIAGFPNMPIKVKLTLNTQLFNVLTKCKYSIVYNAKAFSFSFIALKHSNLCTIQADMSDKFYGLCQLVHMIHSAEVFLTLKRNQTSFKPIESMFKLC